MRGLSSPWRWRDLRPFAVAWGLLLIGLETASATVGRELCLGYDFRSFYAAGYLLRRDPTELYDLARQRWVQDHLLGQNVALPFFSPAYIALLFEPFSRMRYQRAYMVFLAFNLLLLPVCFLLARRAFSGKIALWQPRPGLMLLVFFPLQIALLQGQMSVIVLLVCCGTWAALERGRVGLAGLILAAAVFKFNLILPVAALLAVRWGWRFAAGFGSGALGACTASLLLAGARGQERLWPLLRSGSLVTDQGTAAQSAVTVFPVEMVNINALAYAGLHRFTTPGVTFAVTMALSVLVMTVCGWAMRREKRDDLAFTIAVLSGVLVSYHLYVHDLTVLVLPLALLTGTAQHNQMMLASYALPFVLLCFAGPHSLFLVTLVVMWTLWLVLRPHLGTLWVSEVREPAEEVAS